jgi:hypothetical protein
MIILEDILIRFPHLYSKQSEAVSIRQIQCGICLLFNLTSHLIATN